MGLRSEAILHAATFRAPTSLCSSRPRNKRTSEPLSLNFHPRCHILEIRSIVGTSGFSAPVAWRQVA
eukprot:5835708-Amphidinium_carterae.1